MTTDATRTAAGNFPWAGKIKRTSEGRDSGSSKAEIVAECTALRKVAAVLRK